MNINGKLVLDDEQNKIINYIAGKVFKRLKEDSQEEDYLHSNLLLQIIKQDDKELPNHFDETLKTFKKLLLNTAKII
jgi:ferritin-like protein